MRLPIRPLKGRWPAFAERTLQRFFWSDPTVILDPDVDSEQFRTAMSAIHVGETVKITGGNRHPAADALVMDNVDLDGAVIVDVGASDGSTSVDLIRKLPAFREYIIADLYFTISARTSGRRVFLFDAEAECILVVGRRTLAWPGDSRFVHALYARSIRRSHSAPEREITLLNPEVRALMAADPRVTFRTHDVFDPWDQPRPTVIKVANLLRRLYFPDAAIEKALGVILASLDDGGCLLIVDNPRIKGMQERAGLYRREGNRFVRVAETESSPEIADLIQAVTLPSTSGMVADS